MMMPQMTGTSGIIVENKSKVEASRDYRLVAVLKIGSMSIK